MINKNISLIILIIFLCFAVNINPAAAKYSDSLIVGMPANPETLDPAVAVDEESEQIISNIYETLVEIDPALNQVIPNLAVNWYSDSSYMQWVFVLREGVYFTDGTPFNAESVKFSFLRQMDAKNMYHFPKYGYYSYYAAVFNGFPGIISKINVIDKHKIEFIFTKPVPNFLEILSLPQFSIVSSKAVKAYKDNFWTNPVGTGPYKLASWNYGSRLTLEKNNKYWKKTPIVNKIIIQIISNHSYRLSLLEKDNLDIAVGAEIKDYYKFKAANKYKLIQYPYPSDIMLGINCAKPVFKELKVRQAVRLIMSKDIIDQLYVFELPKKKVNYKEIFYKFKNKNSNYIKAYRKLKETKYDKKQEVELICMEGFPLYANETDLIPAKIKFLLRECGFNVKVKNLSQDKFNQALIRGDYDMALLHTYLKNKDESLFYMTYFDQFYPVKYGLNKFHCYSQDLKRIMKDVQDFNTNYNERYALEEMNYYVEGNIPYVFLNRLGISVICPVNINGLRFDNNNCIRFDKIYLK